MGAKPTWVKFLEFEFFYLKRQGYNGYYQNKNQIMITSALYVNLTMKLLIKSYHLLAQKHDKSEILHFGEAVSHFYFR